MHTACIAKLQFKRNTVVRAGADAGAAADAQLRLKKDELLHACACLKAA